MEDDELVEIIHRTLEEKGKESYIPLKQKSGLGKELFNTFRKLDILQELIEDDEMVDCMVSVGRSQRGQTSPAQRFPITCRS